MKYQTRYGQHEIGTPRYSDGVWIRVDTYTSNETGEISPVRCFAAGRNDTSYQFHSYYAEYGNGNYDPRCSCCWLNFSHTIDEHNQNLKAHDKPGHCDDCLQWGKLRFAANIPPSEIRPLHEYLQRNEMHDAY